MQLLGPRPSQATYQCNSVLTLLLFLCFHRGLIASDFTETHYLQDGTDVSLTRNYTVIPAHLDQCNVVLSRLYLNVVAIFYSKPSHGLRFLTQAPRSLCPIHSVQASHCCSRSTWLWPGISGWPWEAWGRTELETTFQGLWDDHLGKSFLAKLTKGRGSLENSPTYGEL